MNTDSIGYTWVRSYGSVPTNAVQSGTDSDGSRIYVGRAHFLGDLLPCKVVPHRNEAYVSHNCREHRVTNYEILCEQKLCWVRNMGRTIPRGAVPGGRTSSGETLYIGRANHRNTLTIGKVHPSHGCLYIPYGGNEITYQSYEILVMK